MGPFHVAHLTVLGMWLGVMVIEVLFEFTPDVPRIVTGWIDQRSRRG